MSATALLLELRDSGVKLTVRGVDLTFDAPAGVLTQERFDQLVRHKQAILVLLDDAIHRRLRLVAESWPEVWRAFWNDRAAFHEREGNLDSLAARELAFHELLACVMALHGVLYPPLSISTSELLGADVCRCVPEIANG